ncbi:unnamed protein product [Euphydryas editha]|uniref:Uncharacterized protein n=1 Tax=Euphydryas editha TaxID=104508 RepID=A0AAU9TLB4_EUPED|nr:unnamed protein product [Euphydryas editha]
MSVLRTPPSTTSTEATLQHKTGGRYGSEPQLNTSMEIQDELTPPSHIYFRNKRPREDEISLSQFQDFKKEIKEVITSLLGQQKKEYEEIASTLKCLQQTTANIELSVSLLTSQNEEFQKKIDKLESQSKKDREYISLLEDKIEDLQRTSN